MRTTSKENIMAEKQTILGRIAQLAKANINALLDKAEDPQKMIDQLIRDYTNSIIEAENAIAQTLGNLRPEPTSGTTWPRLPSASRSSSRTRSRPRSPLSPLSATWPSASRTASLR